MYGKLDRFADGGKRFIKRARLVFCNIARVKARGGRADDEHDALRVHALYCRNKGGKLVFIHRVEIGSIAYEYFSAEHGNGHYRVAKFPEAKVSRLGADLI